MRPAAGPHPPLQSPYSHPDKVLLCYGDRPPRCFFFSFFFPHHLLDLSGHGPPTEGHSCQIETWPPARVLRSHGCPTVSGRDGGRLEVEDSALSSFPPPTQGQIIRPAPQEGWLLGILHALAHLIFTNLMGEILSHYRPIL